MKHYIAVDENNAYKNHPVLESNLKRVFPEHDFNSGPPSGWLEFERVLEPILGPYECFDDTIGAELTQGISWHNGLEYKLIDGKYKDVWHVKQISDEDKKAKQDKVKADWAALDSEYQYPSWTFNETKCDYVAPVSMPDDLAEGEYYQWNESTTSWDKKIIPTE